MANGECSSLNREWVFPTRGYGHIVSAGCRLDPGGGREARGKMTDADRKKLGELKDIIKGKSKK